MEFGTMTTDEGVLNELGRRVARHRLARNLSQADLAREAGVSRRTIVRMEAGEPSTLINLIRILRALGLLENFETLVPEPGPSPLQQLKLQGRQRRRASSSAAPPDEPDRPWNWGDDPEDDS